MTKYGRPSSEVLKSKIWTMWGWRNADMISASRQNRRERILVGQQMGPQDLHGISPGQSRVRRLVDLAHPPLPDAFTERVGVLQDEACRFRAPSRAASFLMSFALSNHGLMRSLPPA